MHEPTTRKTYLCKTLTKCKKLPFLTSSKHQFLFYRSIGSVPVPEWFTQASRQTYSTLSIISIELTFCQQITRTAVCIIVRARSSTKSGKVALNNDWIIEGLVHAFKMESICFSRPSSNSLSDSSRTRYSALLKPIKMYQLYRSNCMWKKLDYSIYCKRKNKVNYQHVHSCHTYCFR